MDLIGSLVSERAMNFYKCLPEVSLFENEMKQIKKTKKKIKKKNEGKLKIKYLKG